MEKNTLGKIITETNIDYILLINMCCQRGEKLCFKG